MNDAGVEAALDKWYQTEGSWCNLANLKTLVHSLIAAHTEAALDDLDEETLFQRFLDNDWAPPHEVADLTTRLASAEGERDSHWTELVRINIERNAFRDERDALKAERDWLNKDVGYLREESHRWEKSFQEETLRTSALTREVESLKTAVEQALDCTVKVIQTFYGCTEHVYPKESCLICSGRRDTLDQIIAAVQRAALTSAARGNQVSAPTALLSRPGEPPTKGVTP